MAAERAMEEAREARDDAQVMITEITARMETVANTGVREDMQAEIDRLQEEAAEFELSFGDA